MQFYILAAMLIYFVRHGQTDWNRAMRWQGATADNELNANGRAQALAVRDWFAAQPVPDAILSSPLKRAQATAQSIALAFDMPVITEPAFIELGLGEFEGRTTQELEQQYGERFRKWLDSYHLIAPPGGENLGQATERMLPALMDHIDTNENRLVIVAHQAILMAMKAALSVDMTPETLATYKQANDEIDLWDYATAGILERVKLTW